MTEYRNCPQEECFLEAEVLDMWIWGSTDGPVTHYEQRCPLGHYFSGLTDDHYHRR